MAKSRRRFTKECKAEVVNLITKEGRAVSAVCRETSGEAVCPSVGTTNTATIGW